MHKETSDTKKRILAESKTIEEVIPKHKSTENVAHNTKIDSTPNITYCYFKFKNSAKELSRQCNFLSYLKSGVCDAEGSSPKPSFLPPNKSLDKKIFIDLNGTLIYQNIDTPHEIVIRPGAYELLVELSKYYEINVWL
jgi:hypothetical protein